MITFSEHIVVLQRNHNGEPSGYGADAIHRKIENWKMHNPSEFIMWSSYQVTDDGMSTRVRHGIAPMSCDLIAKISPSAHEWVDQWSIDAREGGELRCVQNDEITREKTYRFTALSPTDAFSYRLFGHVENAGQRIYL